MAEYQYKKGDIVTLKSGGPLMTIGYTIEGIMEKTESVEVYWFDGNRLIKETLPTIVIELEPGKANKLTGPNYSHSESCD